MAMTADGLERLESEDAARAEPAQPAAARTLGWWLHRLGPARLTGRIALLNLAGLIVLMLGIIYFNQFRQGLIDARVQSLSIQANIIAAALAGAATVDTGNIVVDPDALGDSQDETAPDADQLRDIDFPINPETAGPVLRRLLSNTTIRARIIDPDGNMIVDSKFLYGRGEISQSELPPLDAPSDNSLTALWNRLSEWAFTNAYDLEPEYGLDNGKEYGEVAAALNGASVSVVRVNARNEIIVLVAVPVQRYRAVLGALVLSTSGGEIDNVLWAERRVVLSTFAFVALVTVLLSVLLAGTIAEPLRKLSAAAERVRRGINTRVEIPDFTPRRDEIGHLSGALRDMTTALYNRIDSIEAFAADVSHELKNPLTSLRSAVETLPFVKTDDQRERLIAIVKDDVRRLDRLITDISDASRLDAELARAEVRPLDAAQLLQNIVSLANETRKERAIIKLEVQSPPAAFDGARAFLIHGHDARLGQVVRNLFDNARSFANGSSTVRVRLRRLTRDIELRVEDEGPGIRPDNLERIFERFYTDRPEGSFGKNSGLGLSISRQIVEAHKGRIWAENRYGRGNGADSERPVLGARFIVRLPAAPGRSVSAVETIHATCVAIGESGVLILGPPGAGKSDLALRLIDAPCHSTGEEQMRAVLVADDQTAIRSDGAALIASAPAALAGRLEVRGLGIVPCVSRAQARLRLAVQLTETAAIERMPDPATDRFTLLGHALPLFRVDAKAASAPARVRAALLMLG